MNNIKSHNYNDNNYTGVSVLNMFLIAAIMFMAIYYVVISNTITSSNYRIGLLNSKLASLMESNGLLTAQRLSIENSSTILNFAESRQMVKMGHVTHIFESGDVALSH